MDYNITLLNGGAQLLIYVFVDISIVFNLLFIVIYLHHSL